MSPCKRFLWTSDCASSQIVSPSHNAIEVEAITIFELDREGRCVERWVRLDEMSFLQQIGAMLAPAAASA